MKHGAGFDVSQASYRCRGAIPSLRSVSSRDLGWTSLLVDVHTGIAWHEAYAAATTLDPRIGVSLAGNYMSQFHSGGRWRPDVYRTGTTTVLRVEDDRRFRFAPLDGDDCQFALIYLPLDQLAAAVESFRRPGQRSAIPWFNQLLAQDQAITQVTRALIAAMQAGAQELYAETVSAWMAAHVLVRRGAFGSGGDSRSAGDLSDRRLRRVLDLMAARFADPLTLDQLAEEAGISKFHFARLFREKVGQPPHRYLTETRLSAARHLLTTTTLSVGEIAVRCGYAAGPQFTSAFVARFGTSPTRFRAAHAPR